CSCYSPHRYLHSFPTRRSSDLQGREASGQGGAVPVGQDCCGVGRRSCVHQGVGGQQDVEETVLFEAFGGGVSDGVVQSGRALEGHLGGDGGLQQGGEFGFGGVGFGGESAGTELGVGAGACQGGDVVGRLCASGHLDVADRTFGQSFEQ